MLTEYHLPECWIGIRLPAGWQNAPIDLPADFEVGLKYGEAFESHEEEISLLKDCHERALRFHQMVLDAKASESVCD